MKKVKKVAKPTVKSLQAKFRKTEKIHTQILGDVHAKYAVELRNKDEIIAGERNRSASYTKEQIGYKQSVIDEQSARMRALTAEKEQTERDLRHAKEMNAVVTRIVDQFTSVQIVSHGMDVHYANAVSSPERLRTTGPQKSGY